MSKRRSKKNKSPNLPESTLARARRQVSNETNEEPEVNEDVEATLADDEASDAEKLAAAELALARMEQQKRIRERKRVQNKQNAETRTQGTLDQDYIQERLMNPTKEVSEAELRENYGFVLTDLRNMLGLAVGLMVFLVILAQVV